LVLVVLEIWALHPFPLVFSELVLDLVWVIMEEVIIYFVLRLALFLVRPALFLVRPALFWVRPARFIRVHFQFYLGLV
jgi:hypothetical protein